MNYGRQLEGNEYDWYYMFVTARQPDFTIEDEVGITEHIHELEGMDGEPIVIQRVITPVSEKGFLNYFTVSEWSDFDIARVSRKAVAGSEAVIKEPAPIREEDLTGIQLIARERERQVETLGYDAYHDSFETEQELAVAAGLYAINGTYADDIIQEYVVVATDGNGSTDELWPWKGEKGNEHDKRGTTTRIRQLTIAGALIAAEIDRLKVTESK